MQAAQQLKQDGDLSPWDFADMLMNADTLLHLHPPMPPAGAATASLHGIIHHSPHKQQPQPEHQQKSAFTAWSRDVAQISLSLLQSALAQDVGSHARKERVEDAIKFHDMLLKMHEKDSPERALRVLQRFRGGWYRRAMLEMG
jgi:hypothetical protein